MTYRNGEELKKPKLSDADIEKMAGILKTKGKLTKALLEERRREK